jgi:DNA topoisomerase-1
MIHATINTVSVDLACGSEQDLFRATGSVIAKPGFMAVYLEGKDDNKESDDKETFCVGGRAANTVFFQRFN